MCVFWESWDNNVGIKGRIFGSFMFLRIISGGEDICTEVRRGKSS